MSQNGSMRLLGVFAGFDDLGGGDQNNRHMAAALARSVRTRGGTYLLLSRNGQSADSSFVAAGERFPARGLLRSRLRLVLSTLWLGRRADVVFFGHPHFAPLVPALRVINPRATFLVAVLGFEIWSPMGRLRRLGLRMADRVVANSTDTREAVVREQGVDLRRAVVLPCCLDPSFLSRPRARPAAVALPPGARVILSVGRLLASEPGKGVDTVLRALRPVLERVPDAFYVVVGRGDLLDRLRALARDLDVSDRVLFTGAVSDEALLGYYRAADVFALPSSQEGFGIVFLEAMALGKPVIAGDIGGSTDVVEDGTTGFVVPCGDVERLATHLLELLTDEPLRRRMGEAGERRVHQLFTFDLLQQRMDAILDGVLASRRGSSLAA